MSCLKPFPAQSKKLRAANETRAGEDFTPSSCDALDAAQPEVSVADCDAVWSLWQDRMGESQLETLCFWSKAILFLANNSTPFEKQFLACPLALAETKHLTIDYEVIV